MQISRFRRVVLRERAVYLAALALLQIAFVRDVAPPLAQAFVQPPWNIAFPSDWVSVAHVASSAFTLAAAAFALAFPLLAFLRHTQRGALRFTGLPRLSARLCIAGAAVYAATQACIFVTPIVIEDFAASLEAVVRSAAIAALAVMAAGALCAEILRRSVAPLRVPLAPWACRPARIEVIDPPELATRAG